MGIAVQTKLLSYPGGISWGNEPVQRHIYSCRDEAFEQRWLRHPEANELAQRPCANSNRRAAPPRPRRPRASLLLPRTEGQSGSPNATEPPKAPGPPPPAILRRNGGKKEKTRGLPPHTHTHTTGTRPRASPRRREPCGRPRSRYRAPQGRGGAVSGAVTCGLGPLAGRTPAPRRVPGRHLVRV